MSPAAGKGLPLLARIKVAVKEAAVPVVRVARGFRQDPGQAVFVLAHMRSGSSLLQHILASHPVIFGRGERNKAYRGTWDLDRLIVDVCVGHKSWPRKGALFVDQINHGRFIQDDRLLIHPRVRKIFLIREPFGAIGSLVHVLGQHYEISLEQAIRYYVERLDELRRYAESEERRENQFFLTYDDLLGPRRRQVLTALSEFLGLESELSEEYQTFRFTGKSGDPAEKIFSGRISDKSREWPLELTSGREQELQILFEECSKFLRASCLG